MTDLMDSPLFAPLADLLTPDKVETLQEMARVFYSNSNLTVSPLPAAIASAALLGLLALYIMLVNPLGFWVAFLDEVSGFMSNNGAASASYGQAYAGSYDATASNYAVNKRSARSLPQALEQKASLHPKLLEKIEASEKLFA